MTVAGGCDLLKPPANGRMFSGTWDTAPNPSCMDQYSTVTFNSDGTGITYTPECTGQCQKSQNYVELTWSASSEFTGTLTMTYGRTVTCGQEQSLPDQTVTPSFTCDATTLEVDGVMWTRR